MKKGLLSLAILLGASAMMQAKGAKDPVLMTIGGQPVTLSEFEYLYHKNNAQQATPQAIEEYLQLFIPYRQKVAAARAQGLDKSQAFAKEFDSYLTDLAAPYMIDTEVQDSLYHAQYDRMRQEVNVSHIMLFYQSPDRTDLQKRELMDSLLVCLDNGESFDSLATRFSADLGSANRGGNMGYITAGRYPYTFEDAAYTTAVGAHSKVITTPYGYHIVKVLDRRDARGQVLAEHILRLTRGKSDEEAAAQKELIDSLYNVAASGADFEALATQWSEDPGSARNGGRLPWFGPGQMVPEFEETAFTLANGEISKPFATAYGYHIIKKLDSKGIESYENLKNDIAAAIGRDERSQLPARRRMEQLKKQYKAKVDTKALDRVAKSIIQAGGVDSTLYAQMLADNLTVASVGKDKLPLSEVVSQQLPNGFAGDADAQVSQLKAAVEKALETVVREKKQADLMATEPAYRNLVNEYRDGMLMFEIQDQNVWSKAKNDTTGLNAFFQANKEKYRWESPRFKSRIIFAENDSVLGKVNEYLAANPTTGDQLQGAMMREFGKSVKVERVLAAKGENGITDYLAFGADKPVASGRWVSYEAFEPKLIEQPEEVLDVRSLVITDYQDYLLEQWMQTLAEQYPAVVDRKVLSQAK